jgi:hypothetical protein
MALTAIHPGEHLAEELAEELEALDMSAAEPAREKRDEFRERRTSA